MIEVYLTTSNDGQQVCMMGMGGARMPLWDAAAQLWVDRFVQFGGQPHCMQHCFNDTAMVNGIDNESLKNATHYYIGAYLPSPSAIPRIAFVSPLPASRYSFTQYEGIPYFDDAAGNRCTLLAMCYPIGNSVLTKASGANSRILTSTSPWGAPSQPLPINSTQMGGTFTNTSPQEINSDLGIYACAWAWRGVKSYFGGRLADNSGTPTVFIRPFARSMIDQSMHYGAVIIAQFPYAGFNIPLSGTGISLALDDGVYYYGIEGWVSHGAAHIQIEHIVDGWI